MKNIILIFFSSFLLFFTLSILEEWDNFKYFFKGEKKIIEEVPDEALQTVLNFNNLLVHFYKFGDERFLQRLPASDNLKDEYAFEIYFLNSNNKIQELNLKNIEILKKEVIRKNLYKISTFEEWEIYLRDLTGHPLIKKPESFSSSYYYIVSKRSGEWIVEEMGFLNED